MKYLTSEKTGYNVLFHRVMEEIEEVVGDKTTVEADDLDKLTYMNQVLLYQ